MRVLGQDRRVGDEHRVARFHQQAHRWQYFLSIRPWFFGGLLLLNGIDLIDTFLKGFDWGARSTYLWYWLPVTLSAVIGLVTERGIVVLVLGLMLQVWSNLLTVYEQGVLGGW